MSDREGVGEKESGKERRGEKEGSKGVGMRCLLSASSLKVSPCVYIHICRILRIQIYTYL